jgi:hypothetical protein
MIGGRMNGSNLKSTARSPHPVGIIWHEALAQLIQVNAGIRAILES